LWGRGRRAHDATRAVSSTFDFGKQATSQRVMKKSRKTANKRTGCDRVRRNNIADIGPRWPPPARRPANVEFEFFTGIARNLPIAKTRFVMDGSPRLRQRAGEAARILGNAGPGAASQGVRTRREGGAGPYFEQGGGGQQHRGDEGPGVLEDNQRAPLRFGVRGRYNPVGQPRVLRAESRCKHQARWPGAIARGPGAARGRQWKKTCRTIRNCNGAKTVGRPRRNTRSANPNAVRAGVLGNSGSYSAGVAKTRSVFRAHWFRLWRPASLAHVGLTQRVS